MNPVDLLSEMIALEAAAPTHSLRHRQGYNDLLGFGFFRETGAISAVVCAECSDPHTAQIKFEDSTYGYYCPELCFVELARERMNTVTPNLPFLIGQLADAFDCKRRKATPVYGETWRIGSVSTDQGDIVLCFLPRLSDEDDARQLADALSREVHAPSRLVVSAEGQLPISIAMTVTLNELVEMSPRNGCLIPQFDLCTLGDVP